ncbi:unnamed protein product [Heterobilharzia americana]|nr:unnamed protein product [Heterobilharzia americana]
MEFCAALEERRKFLLNHLQRQVKDSKELVENSQESCDQLPLSETNYANIYSELVKEVEWKAINRFQRLINNIEMLSKGLKSAPVNDEAVKLDIHKIIEAHLKRQSTTKDSVLNTEKLYSLLEAEKSERLSNNLASKKLKGSVSRRLHPVVSQSYMKNLYQLSGTNGKTEKVLEKSWPKSENGFFCLLPQICEHVREWQLYNQSRLRKLGRAYNWIDRVEDWSSVTPHALTFLTAESVAESIVPNGSRRLICPRPFVDSKPRIHQWCWLLCPPSGTNSKLVQEWNYKFELETKEWLDYFLNGFELLVALED